MSEKKRLLFTGSIPRGVFCECSTAEVTENPGAAAPNRVFCGLCASRSVLRFTERLRFSRAVDSNSKRNTAGIFLLLAGLALFTYGGRRLEPDVVLMKAITICMECIGIG